MCQPETEQLLPTAHSELRPVPAIGGLPSRSDLDESYLFPANSLYVRTEELEHAMNALTNTTGVRATHHDLR